MTSGGVATTAYGKYATIEADQHEDLGDKEWREVAESAVGALGSVEDITGLKKDITLEEEIGRGAFGRVYKVKEFVFRQTVGSSTDIKAVKVSRGGEDEAMLALLQTHASKHKLKSTTPVYQKNFPTVGDPTDETQQYLYREYEETFRKVSAMSQNEVAVHNFVEFLRKSSVIQSAAAGDEREGTAVVAMPIVHPLSTLALSRELARGERPDKAGPGPAVRVRPLTAAEAADDARTLLLWLRSAKIQHLDMHPNNIMVYQQGVVVKDLRKVIESSGVFRPNLPHSLTLIDFGLATRIGKKPRSVNVRLASRHLMRTRKVCRNCDAKSLYLLRCWLLQREVDPSVTEAVEACKLPLEKVP